jgi:hypothetical protein
MFDRLDYRFSDRKPKRGVAKVRIKSITVSYEDRPLGTALDLPGQEYGQKFRENGTMVEAIMKMVVKNDQIIRFERAV